MGGANRDYLGGGPVKPKKVVLAPKGRTCDRPECNTILSTYNDSSTCSIHERSTRLLPERRRT
jgi:hypothetical protein